MVMGFGPLILSSVSISKYPMGIGWSHHEGMGKQAPFSDFDVRAFVKMETCVMDDCVCTYRKEGSFRKEDAAGEAAFCADYESGTFALSFNG